MATRKVVFAICLLAAAAGCGGGGVASQDQGGLAGAAAVMGSSRAASGSTAVYTRHGVTHAATPGESISGFGTARLLLLPNTGSAAAHTSELASVGSRVVMTSLAGVDITGVAVDPEAGFGAAYGNDSGLVSVFSLSTGTEICVYDTETVNSIWYTGAPATKIAGIVMDPSTKTMIMTTADGIETADYSKLPARPEKKLEVPSLDVDEVNGVEIIENFAYHDSLSVSGASYRMLITGGHDPEAMVLVDTSTGRVYRPDTQTKALFTVDDYIDAAAVDTVYNVAVLADEGAGTTFVDLGKLTLDTAAGTYRLPASAVSRVDAYVKFTNVAVDSRTHMVMLGKGYGGTELVAAELEDPAAGLGFARAALVQMPSGVDDSGAEVVWAGSGDPHGAGVYLTSAENPSYAEQAALGVWLSELSTHLAVINLKNVLDGALLGGGYDPMAANPVKDISYFRVP